MEKNKKSRLTNIEILRIVAMLMIIFYHIVLHCVNVQLHGGDSIIKISSKIFNKPIFFKKLFILHGMMTWGPIGNALFMLISGYFMVNSNKEINITKVSKKLLLQLGFASIVLVVSSTLLYKINIIKSFIQLININTFNSMSWYVGFYFLVIFMAHLFLNKYLKNLDKKQYITFLIIIFALTQFKFTIQVVNNFSDGLINLLTGVFFYSLGGYLNKYNPFKNVKFITIILIMIISNLLIFFSAYNINAVNIENYLINSSKGFSQSIINFGNNSILVVILSLCIFEIFARLKIKNNKFINYIASGTFMVYLLHDNGLFYSLWGTINWLPILYHNPLKFIIIFIIAGLLTFIIGIIVYVLYNLTIKLSLKYKDLFLKKTVS